MADDASVDFYNKYLKVVKTKLDSVLTDALSLETQSIKSPDIPMVLKMIMDFLTLHFQQTAS